MKKSAPLLLLCVVLGISSNAQLTLLPQVGLENSITSLQFNNLPSIKPKDLQLSPKLGVRLDYQFKKIGGAYVGLSTSRSSVNVNLSSPENGMTLASISTGALQLRLEAGYQINSKPIYLNKAATAASVKSASANVTRKLTALQRARPWCVSYRTRDYNQALSQLAAAQSEKGWYVSVQPSVGFAYLPGVRSTVSTQSVNGKSTISYVVGNMNSAVVAGTGFEFGENDTKKFNVTLQYVRGIGNLNNQMVSTLSGSKTTTTMLGSKVSGFNVSVGIPINLIKKKQAVKAMPVIEQKKAVQPRSRCAYYRMMQSI